MMFLNDAKLDFAMVVLFQEQFEAVNQAYEFLCSRSSWNADGPNPHNIVLILQTQSILFHRYSQGKIKVYIFIHLSLQLLHIGLFMIYV